MPEEQLSFLPPPASRWWERMIVVIPAIAVVGLAALYAVGALLKAAQLEGAGLVISDTLSLLPLETILGAGIGVVIRSAILLVGIGAIVLGGPALLRQFFAWMDRRAAERDKRVDELSKRIDALDEDSSDLDEEVNFLAADVQRQKRQDKIRRLGIKIMGGLAGFAVVGLVLLFTPVVAVAYSISVLGIVIALVLGLNIRKFAPYYLSAQYLLLLGAYVVSAFVYPTPLPRASVNTGKRVASGELVAVTSTAWYLANERRIEAIPVRRMNSAVFASQDRPRPASVGTHILQSLGLE